MPYYQDDFDKWFTKTVDYLTATRSQHKKFKTQMELAALLGIPGEATNFSSIKAGQRGVPKDLRSNVEKKLKEIFNIKRGDSLSMLSDSGRDYHIDHLVPKTQHLAELLAKEERHNKFLRDIYESNLKTMQLSLDSVLVNQKTMQESLNSVFQTQKTTLAQVSAESVLAAQRYAGDDKQLLDDELQKRRTLIGEALKEGL